jgi:NAD(P)-dependent dehydrogenase (short-subunit alcohol dehydrogenase family)
MTTPQPAPPAVKTAVVTGGASGIGAGIARRLQKDGYNVAVLDLNPATEGFGVIANVTSREQIDAALAQVREKFGPITILVNSAGKDSFKRFHDLTWERWEQIIAINLHGVFHMTQAVLPDMMAAKWGRIVNISSSSTLGGQPFMTAYVSSKSAINGLTKSLALEYGPYGITVNAVPPGFIDTPMLRTSEERGLLGGTVEDHVQRTPVRRIGTPDDIAAACSFLISEEAGYITGQLLTVSGGRNT